MPTRRLTFRRLLLHAGVWIMATALASSLAWATVSRLGGDSLDSNPRTLSQADVRRELGQLDDRLDGRATDGVRPVNRDESTVPSAADADHDRRADVHDPHGRRRHLGLLSRTRHESDHAWRRSDHRLEPVPRKR